ncbi:hypothetical protein [Amorphus sp. MBR-141]
MIEAYRASEMIADFAAAVRDAKTMDRLDAVGRDNSASILRHGVRSLCAEIYSRRKLELSQPGDGGGEAA